MTAWRTFLSAVVCAAVLVGVSCSSPAEMTKKSAAQVSDTRRLAEQGYAAAEQYLGWLYYNGQGVPQDNGQAAAWFRKAADQGHREAQYMLGFSWHNGQGVPKDLTQAAAWYRKAADQGDARAKYNLGVLYDNSGLAARGESRCC